MIDITRSKDPARVLRNACEPNINQPGSRIIYHVGDYSDDIGRSDVGRAAMELHRQGRVDLFQRVIAAEPRRYEYIAVIK